MPEQNVPENVVLVGKKPPTSYVLAVITQFSNGRPEVVLKARGKNISKAVDVAEIVKRRFIHAIKTKNIEIGTEERVLENGTKVNVSTISITLSK
ncbi:MAG: DNA-binding protein Alba [Candidatus Aenigmarchaeota archaeon]|nr:DNA-binding protein Alba [Candidatus Aenigmarchaeota archaeon]MDW8149461.1 DNA-binding protein Alba [Candidatus Aenigmarchaeota archaeon]